MNRSLMTRTSRRGKGSRAHSILTQLSFVAPDYRKTVELRKRYRGLASLLSAVVEPDLVPALQNPTSIPQDRHHYWSAVCRRTHSCRLRVRGCSVAGDRLAASRLGRNRVDILGPGRVGADVVSAKSPPARTSQSVSDWVIGGVLAKPGIPGHSYFRSAVATGTISGLAADSESISPDFRVR